jgi:hypothetical protein
MPAAFMGPMPDKSKESFDAVAIGNLRTSEQEAKSIRPTNG